MWNFLIDFPVNHLVFFQFPQLPCQYPFRNIRQQPLKLIKPSRLRAQIPQDDDFPFACDDVLRLRNGANLYLLPYNFSKPTSCHDKRLSSALVLFL